MQNIEFVLDVSYMQYIYTLLGYSVHAYKFNKLITCVYHYISQLYYCCGPLDCASTTSEDLLDNNWFEAAVKKLSSFIHTTGRIYI